MGHMGRFLKLKIWTAPPQKSSGKKPVMRPERPGDGNWLSMHDTERALPGNLQSKALAE